MPVTLTTGLFPVAQLPAAQVVSVRVFLGNLENQPHRGTVVVSRLEGTEKQRILVEELEMPGDQLRTVELPSSEVEGHTIEVTVTVPTNGFGLEQLPLVPGVAVVSLFTGDQTTSVLQWIPSGGFAALPETDPAPAAATRPR